MALSPSASPSAAALHDTFGSEAADADFARADLDGSDSVFLQTADVKEFVERQPDYTYVVGTMGIGKSILLLKKWSHLERTKPGVLLAPRSAGRVYTPSATFANTVRSVAFWKLTVRGEPNIDAWTQVWEWALLGCVLRHWQAHAESRGDTKQALDLASLMDNPNIRDDPFDSIASQLEVDESSAAAPHSKSALPQADHLRRYLERYANEFPPTYVFLDNQDDFFNDEPSFWTASATGCQYAIEQLHRRSGHRVHFFLTLRPEVLWTTAMHSHATRAHGAVFRTEWSHEHLVSMFSKRAARLRDNLLISPHLRQRNPLAAFFGPRFFDIGDRTNSSPYILNYGAADGQPRREGLMSYLIRHTLGRPRELIIHGNEILAHRRAAAVSESDTQEIVREAVAFAANRIALAYLGEIKHRWRWQRAHERPEEAIRRFLKDRVEHNVFKTSDITDIEREFVHSCDGMTYEEGTPGPLAMLASAGLIGWPNTDIHKTQRLKQYFPRPGDSSEQTLSQKTRWLLVHPVLYGDSFGIKARKGLIVGNGLEWTAP